MNNYHIPVMLKECVEALNIKENGIYVDVTFGGGGHSKAILEKLGPKGKLLAFDRDIDAQTNKPKNKNFILIDHSFEFMKNFLRFENAEKVDGILADLGISSHQIDNPARGFAHRFDGPLDMRMDKDLNLSAADIINEWSERDLIKMFREYGEIQNAPKLVSYIVSARAKAPVETIEEFKEQIKPCIPQGKESKYLSQVFQAIRIEVNQELHALKKMLKQSLDVLKPGARLVVMSYHSLEDRLVKNFMASGNFEGKVERDIYGKYETPFKVLNKKAITADELELAANPRSRSAKLRVAEKI